MADSSAPSRQAILILSSSPDSAWVYLGAKLAGRTPCTLMIDTPSVQYLRLLHPDRENWLTGSVFDTLRCAPGDTVVRRYALDRWTMVTSSPPGAEVFHGDSLVGTTPLLVPPGRVPPDALIHLRKRGYDPAIAQMGGGRRGILSVPLMASHDPGAEPDQSLLPHSAPSSLRLYLSGGGAVIAGAAAAYFKVKADNRNSDYLATGDPVLASERDRFDRASGVFLAAAQVSIGLFMAFLLSE
jgi:hypothetical protein